MVHGLARKIRLIARGNRKPAPRWADIKAFGKRARTHRLKAPRKKHWRHGRLKV